jgi:drug/metabolite transporter (DMT)-like permease
MNEKTTGYIFAFLAVGTFAALDGCSKFLGDRYSPYFITMVRFWGFAVFVTLLAAYSPGGIKRALATRNPLLQISRGVLLVTTSGICVASYKYAGLAMSQAVLQITPLLVTLLSIPLLGEVVGWRRATAVGVGLVGVLIIINPTHAQAQWALLLPITGAALNALYYVATRAAGKRDSSQTSALYAGVTGALTATIPGFLTWESVASADWLPLAALCVSGTLGHYFLIRAYAVLEALEVQPLVYIQLVFGVGVAVLFFDEALTPNMIAGAVLVTGSGLFSVWREHSKKQSATKRRQPAE